jgi:hypothetical protein
MHVYEKSLHHEAGRKKGRKAGRQEGRKEGRKEDSYKGPGDGCLVGARRNVEKGKEMLPIDDDAIQSLTRWDEFSRKRAALSYGNSYQFRVTDGTNGQNGCTSVFRLPCAQRVYGVNASWSS